MKIEINFLEIPSFEEDIVLFGVPDKTIDLLKRNLAKNPLLGEVVPGEAGLRTYEMASYYVVYKPVYDFRTIILLQIRPIEKGQPTLGANAEKLLKKIAPELLISGLKKWLGL